MCEHECVSVSGRGGATATEFRGRCPRRPQSPRLPAGSGSRPPFASFGRAVSLLSCSSVCWFRWRHQRPRRPPNLRALGVSPLPIAPRCSFSSVSCAEAGAAGPSSVICPGSGQVAAEKPVPPDPVFAGHRRVWTGSSRGAAPQPGSPWGHSRCRPQRSFLGTPRLVPRPPRAVGVADGT